MATKSKIGNAKKLPTTWEEICEFKKLDPVKCLPDVSMMPTEFQNKTVSTVKLFIITDCLNIIEDGKSFEPDWGRYDEYKWIPVFWMDEPGFRFDGSVYYVVGAGAGTGARLCFRTRALSDFAGKTFTTLYEQAMVF